MPKQQLLQLTPETHSLSTRSDDTIALLKHPLFCEDPTLLEPYDIEAGSPCNAMIWNTNIAASIASTHSVARHVA
jgi:hypothetical protein